MPLKKRPKRVAEWMTIGINAPKNPKHEITSILIQDFLGSNLDPASAVCASGSAKQFWTVAPVPLNSVLD